MFTHNQFAPLVGCATINDTVLVQKILPFFLNSVQRKLSQIFHFQLLRQINKNKNQLVIKVSSHTCLLRIKSVILSQFCLYTSILTVILYTWQFNSIQFNLLTNVNTTTSPVINWFQQPLVMVIQINEMARPVQTYWGSSPSRAQCSDPLKAGFCGRRQNTQWVCVVILYGDVIRVIIKEDETSSQAKVASVVDHGQDERVDTFSLNTEESASL